MIRFRPAAARELASDFRYYEKDSPSRGRRFVDAVGRALAQIAESPGGFPLLFEPDIRSAKVKRFPYRVVYVVVGEDVDVIAVAPRQETTGVLAPTPQIDRRRSSIAARNASTADPFTRSRTPGKWWR